MRKPPGEASRLLRLAEDTCILTTTTSLNDPSDNRQAPSWLKSLHSLYKIQVSQFLKAVR